MLAEIPHPCGSAEKGDFELPALRKRGWTITAIANHAKLDRKAAPAAKVIRWGDKRG